MSGEVHVTRKEQLPPISSLLFPPPGSGWVFFPFSYLTFPPPTKLFSGLWTTSQSSPGPAAPPIHQHLLRAEKAFPIHLQGKGMVWRNFLWPPCSKHSFLPLGHRLGSSSAQQGSYVSRSWTLSLSSITLWWGDTTTHEGQSRFSAPGVIPQNDEALFESDDSSLLCSFWYLPFWHYPMFPFPPHLCLSSLFSPQSHPMQRCCCRSPFPLPLLYFFSAETSCVFVHTIPSSFLLLPHFLTQHSSVWFWPLKGCWCGMNPNH